MVDGISSEQIVTAVISLAVGAGSTYLTAYLKIRNDLKSKYDISLRRDRIKEYKAIWEKLEVFSMFSPQTINYSCLKEILKQLREWYYRQGGIFMTEGTRDTYFALQRELTETITSAVYGEIKEKLDVDKSMNKEETKNKILNYIKDKFGESLRIKMKKRYDNSNDLEVEREESIMDFARYLVKAINEKSNPYVESIDKRILEDEKFENIRFKASSLRTALSRDVGSRKESLLNNAKIRF